MKIIKNIKEKNIKPNLFIKDKKYVNGITLIALVVTIIILMILAGVTINILLGKNGIVEKSQKARNITLEKSDKEINNINELNNIFADNELTVKDQGKKVKVKKATYKDETGTAIIPKGFCVAKSINNDLNTVEMGLVISDKEDDDLNNTKSGNQFVWIPVSRDNYKNFHLIEGYYLGKTQNYLSSSKEAGPTEILEDITNKNMSKGSSESIEMYKSVIENQGFYIARFEAGIAGSLDNDALDKKTVDDGTVKPLSQKKVGVWNYITWGSEGTSELDGLQGNDTKTGAVVVARSMYKDDKEKNVVSTLCYGVQWDAVMCFIDPEFLTKNNKKDDVVNNGNGRGNYSGSIKLTGSSEDYQHNHIYDLGGNVFEWTMEAYTNQYRIGRGGYYNSGSGGKGSPASVRNNKVPTYKLKDYGFRVALYVK